MPNEIKNDTLIFAEILNKSDAYADGLTVDIFADNMTATRMWVNDQDDTAVVYSHEVRTPDSNDKTVLIRVTTNNAFIYGEADAVYALIADA